MHLSALLTVFFTSSLALAAEGYGYGGGQAASTVTLHPTSTVTVAADTFTTPTSTDYLLKTRLVNRTDTSFPVTDYSKARFSGLYLWAYHTGAGLNDAVVSGNKSFAITGFLNVTDTTGGKTEGYQQFNLTGTTFPWGFDFTIGTYSGWGEVQINVGAQTPGFYFTTQHGLLWGGNSSSEGGSFGGWLGKFSSSSGAASERHSTDIVHSVRLVAWQGRQAALLEKQVLPHLGLSGAVQLRGCGSDP
jgi:hypothetical protein